MKVLFIATLLVLGAFAVEAEEGMDVLNKMEKSEYGRNILDTIALQMESGDPADDLIHMLQDLEDKLESEQDADDEFIMALENQCVEDLAKLVDEIASTRKRIQELSDLLAALKPIKAKKEAEKADLEEFAALIREKLQEIEVAKQTKDAEWKEEAQEHDALTAIIERGKNIIVGALSASFLQTNSKTANPQVLAEVSAHFNNARKQHFKRKSYGAIFKVLAQMTNAAPVQVSQSVVEKIIAICDDLLDKIAESRAIEKADYDHWIREYQSTKSKLSTKLQETEARIAQLEVDITVLTKRINLASSEYDEQVIRLSQKMAQHDERENFCDEAGHKYAKDREARDDQREVISDAIGLLMAKIRLLKRYVNERVVNLDRPVL